ncbi:MAG: EAL domain-containing protein [Burkholderiaceae bacterium]|nr:EAL domain-containing protein [Burkholderiaceae bacterium]
MTEPPRDPDLPDQPATPSPAPAGLHPTLRRQLDEAGLSGLPGDPALLKLLSLVDARYRALDPTGAPERRAAVNRRQFELSLETAIAVADARGRRIAVLALDIDRFREINESFGHDAGDALIGAVAASLRECLGDEDLLARFGGDEFIVLVDGDASDAGLHRLATCLQAALEGPFLIGDIPVTLGAGIGIAVYPAGEVDHDLPARERATRLVRNADAAMYRAKERGRGETSFFTQDMIAGSRERLQTLGALRRAAQLDEFVLAYQPIVDVRIGRVVGAEALVRWSHADEGMLLPERFVGLAEETGLIGEIGEFVLGSGLQALAGWRHGPAPEMFLSVNVSPPQFALAGFLDRLATRLADARLPGAALSLEITESMLMGDADRIVATLGAIRDLGVGIALDDFGTGYSSLSYLQRFAIDTIKIDQSFVRAVRRPNDRSPVIEAIVAIAAGVGAKLVAEGVETTAQRDALFAMGCSLMQGLLFSAPVSAATFEPMLTARFESLDS